MTTSLAGVVPAIIDAHIHQWDPFTTPREASRLAPLYRRAPRLSERLLPVLVGKATYELVRTAKHAATPYLPPVYAADAAGTVEAVGVGVEAVVHVEADWAGDDPVEETAWVENLPFGKDGAPELAAIVAHADPREPTFQATLDAHAEASPRFRGIRCMAAWHPDRKVRGWIDREGLLRSSDFLRGFGALVDRRLSFDAYVYGDQLADVVVLAETYPEAVLVLDHFAPPVGALGPMGRDTGQSPAARADILARWRHGIAAVAERPNVTAKLSGSAYPPLGFERLGIGRAELTELVAPMIEHTADAFGEDRLVFGSNFPMDKPIASHGTIVGALADILAPRGPATLRKVFRDNAVRTYRLEQ